MSKQEHSPLPWSVGKFKDVINDVNGYPIIDLWAEGDTHIKDAQFIVEACNNYKRLKAENQRLRDLLRKAVDTIQYDGTGISLRSNIWDMLNEIEKALQQEGDDPCAK